LVTFDAMPSVATFCDGEIEWVDKMRTFHSLIFSRRDPKLRVVVRRELDGFDWTVFRKGLPFCDALPSALRLFVNDGDAPDYLYNPLRWPITSTRLLRILQEQASDDFQPVAAPLYHASSCEAIVGYTIVNVTRIVDCLDFNKSTVSYMQIGSKRVLHVIKYALKETKIPPEVHMFRVAESPSSLMVSDELTQATVGKGLNGFAFVRLTTV
jgi:hypothetical protein